MKRIIIICEGPTEVEFCKDVLYSHFLAKNIYIQTPLIKKSGGGIVPWSVLKKQIYNHLLQDKEALVTTLIDYYGILDKYQFPDWVASKVIANKVERVDLLEKGMKDSIDPSISVRFEPYIQLHEFEALLFNEMAVFIRHIPTSDFIDQAELTNTIASNPNPELINDTPNNAPSYRLKRLIKGYNKIVYGAILAKEIGLNKIRAKNPRFNGWIERLENIT
ncbi:MAG: DUF4276 family protein [Cytophagales bacterium]|nr:DUF4276 family protein [Cytophagales bacterium]